MRLFWQEREVRNVKTVNAIGAMLLVSSVAPGAMAEPVARAAERTVVVSGVSAGGEVVLFGVSRERVEFGTRIRHWKRVEVDADRDGQVVVDLGGPFPVPSAWVAVDMTNGQHALLRAPDDPPGGVVGFPDAALRLEGGRATALVMDVESIDLLVVRPGVGAWRHGAVEGPHERTPEGSLRIPFARLQRLGGAPDGPGELRPGDVLVGIEPWSLVVFLRHAAAE